MTDEPVPEQVQDLSAEDGGEVRVDEQGVIGLGVDAGHVGDEGVEPFLFSDPRGEPEPPFADASDDEEPVVAGALDALHVGHEDAPAHG